MKKKTALLGGFFILVIGLVAAGQWYLANQTKIAPPESKSEEAFVVEKISPTVVRPTVSSEITVNIDFGNGTIWSENATAKNVYEALVTVGKKKGITVETKQYKYGMMIEKIGELANSKEGYWMYSVNGKPGQIAADRFIVNPGDRIEWKYTRI